MGNFLGGRWADRSPHPHTFYTLLCVAAGLTGLVPLIARRQDLVRSMTAELFEAVANGELEVVIGDVYPLSEAARAHTEMRERRTSGKLLLDPSA